jgi:hypothetical protein
MAYQVVKPGSISKLNQELAIQPDKAGIRMQFGKLVDRDNAINRWRANCRFEVDRPAPIEQIIQPEEFTITRVSTKNQLVASDHIQLASVGIGIGINLGMSDGDGGPMGEEMTTIFHLQSETQPKVKQLICQHYEKVEDSRHLMLEEIQQAVGDIFEFRPAP